MAANQSNILLHIPKPLGHAEGCRLLDALRTEPGVTDVSRDSWSSDLLFVDYAPREISALDILRRVKSFGVPACLVGM
jgi:hypothetical protein